MVNRLVLINGLPGSGKSTLAVALAAGLDSPVISKDAIKEALADIAVGTVPSRQLGGVASDTMWGLAGAIPGLVILDSWWFAERDVGFVKAGLASVGDPNFVEVWCGVPPQLAWKRYDERRRHPIHPVGDAAREGWSTWSENPRPLGLGPVIVVDTTRQVDVDRLASDVLRVLGDPAE